MVRSLDPYYYDTNDPGYKGFVKDTIDRYNKGKSKNEQLPEGTTVLGDRPSKGMKHKFVIFVVKRCCVGTLKETVQIIQTVIISVDDNAAKQESNETEENKELIDDRKNAIPKDPIRGWNGLDPIRGELILI